MKTKVLLFGTSSFGLASFDILRNTPDFEIVGVVTQPSRPVGRHQTLTPTPVALWAEQHQLPLFTWSTLRPDEVVKTLNTLSPTVAVVASYGLIVPQPILHIPTVGCVNIHASLLPAYRGASPITAAILHGDTTTGITFMQMDAGLDTGPILKSVSWPIPATSTRPELERELATLAAEQINDVLKKYLAGTIQPVVQPTDGVSLTKKIQRQDGVATWMDAVSEERKMRAYTPWPGVWTTWNKVVLKLERGQVKHGHRSEPPGTVIPYERSWAIVCQRDILVPEIVQMAGKKTQSAEEFLRGQPTLIGTILGR